MICSMAFWFWKLNLFSCEYFRIITSWLSIGLATFFISCSYILVFPSQYYCTIHIHRIVFRRFPHLLFSAKYHSFPIFKILILHLEDLKVALASTTGYRCSTTTANLIDAKINRGYFILAIPQEWTWFSFRDRCIQSI